MIPVCVECKKLGEKSSIYANGSSSTLMSGGPPYWDEDGIYHSHDPNTITSAYSCSKGHAFTIKSRSSCPAPGCTL